MNAYHVIDAFSQSFFALLGIWAAVDRRHWFVRFVAVSGALLVTLLIPAYEVVIEFGLQMILIMAGVWLARGERWGPPRLSLETALLAMVVVAVAAAVVAHIPNLHAAIWAFMLNVGVSTALFSLLALWIVFGKSRLHTRLLLAIPGLALFVLLFHLGSAIERMMWRTSGNFNWMAFLEAYSLDELESWLARNLPTFALAAPVMIGALLLARESRWFEARPTSASEAPPLPRRAIAARFGLGIVFFVVLAPLVFLFYRLLTPPSLARAAPLPSPNAFDDFVVAGNMTPLSLATAVQARNNRRAFEQLFRELQPVADRVAKGLEKESLVPLDDADEWGGIKYETSQAIERALAALFMRAEYYQRYGSTDEFIAEVLTLLEFEQQATRGSVAIMERLWNWHPVVIAELRAAIYRLDAQQLQDLAAQLRELESSREPFKERAARQLLYDQNTVWTRRLAIILDGWSGKSQYATHREAEKRRSMQQRLLIADLAAQAFWLEHRRPPDSWNELVPKYLSAVPKDAFADAPLHYRREGPRYVIYSPAIESIDELIRTRSYRDDQAVSGPYHPPLWIQLRDLAAIGLDKVEQYLHRHGEAPAEP